MNNLVEGRKGHGAKRSPLHKRLYRKVKHRKAMAGVPFDWVKGYELPFTLTVKDQGSNFSCGGQAGSSLLEAQGKLRNDQDVLSAKSIYAPGHADGGGMEFDVLLTQICAHGANLEATVPSNDASGNPLNETMMEEMSWQTPYTIKDAIARAGYTPIRVDVDMESIAQAVRDYGGVIVMLAGQNNGTWLSAYPNPPSKGNPNPLWYHYMTVRGASQVNGINQLNIKNSWGSDVGENGIQHFRQNYFDAGGILEAYAVMYDANLTPVYTPSLTVFGQMWQSVALWFKSQSWFPS